VGAREETAHTATLCSDQDVDLLAALSWSTAKKDLRLVVIDPDGNVFVVDGHRRQSYEFYSQAGPLPEGEWTFIVEYDGTGKVKYDLWVRFADTIS
jgi:uncharacterized protein YfaP (DUF2135 family)